MNGKMKVTVMCPFCRTKDTFDLEPGFHRLLCYPEGGGCDEYYAVDLKIEPTITTYKLEEIAAEEIGEGLGW